MLCIDIFLLGIAWAERRERDEGEKAQFHKQGNCVEKGL